MTKIFLKISRIIIWILFIPSILISCSIIKTILQFLRRTSLLWRSRWPPTIPHFLKPHPFPNLLILPKLIPLPPIHPRLIGRLPPLIQDLLIHDRKFLQFFPSRIPSPPPPFSPFSLILSFSLIPPLFFFSWSPIVLLIVPLLCGRH